MVRHIVMFKFKEEADGRSKAENLIAAKSMLDSLPSKIAGILSQEVHIGGSWQPSDNYDLVLISDFNTPEDLAAYQINPDHVAVGKFIQPLRLSRACVDFDI